MTEKRLYWLITAAQTSYLRRCCYQAKCMLGCGESVACVGTIRSAVTAKLWYDIISRMFGVRRPGWNQKIRKTVSTTISQNKVIKQIISINSKNRLKLLAVVYIPFPDHLRRSSLSAGLFSQAALSMETSTSETSLTSNWAPANGPVCSTLNSLMGHLWRTHCKPVKSPVPPAVVTIMEHRHDKWLFSGFYASAIQSFSIVGILELPGPSKTHFCSSFVVHYTFFPPLIYIYLKAVSTQGYYVTLMLEKDPQSAHPLSCLSSLILPNYVTQMEESSYLCLSGSL